VKWPRVHVDSSFTIGDDKADDERYVDAMGHLQPSGDVGDISMGFTPPSTSGIGYEEGARRTRGHSDATRPVQRRTGGDEALISGTTERELG
jgi:hypothetical protein